MAVTMVRLLALLPGDAGTCRVIENGNGLGANRMDLEKKGETLIQHLHPA